MKNVTSTLSILKDIFKYLLFKNITKKSLNIFLRGSDIISIWPQISGYHEKVLTNFIKETAKNGNSDFLIDIGANIGLTTCQTGNEFDNVICFEPNPLCMNILRVNSEVSLDISKVELYECGLGDNKDNLELWIPKNNWGGAFIHSDSNLYSNETLAKKDGYENIQAANYTIKKVKVESAEAKLTEIFNRLEIESCFKGVIKIDVEGMEESVLRGISKSIPKNTSAYIVFENWENNFDFNKIINFFSHRKIDIFRLGSHFSSNYGFTARYLKIVHKLLSYYFDSKKSHLIDIHTIENKTGDIVICVS
jgi:FkbM family methyltransferase